MSTLVTACYRTLSLTISKGGVVDKSGAFSPTYPQFEMRNLDLRSSCFCETKIVSVFFH